MSAIRYIRACRVLALALACGALAVTAAPELAAQDASRPNILWISVEDMSPRLGAYGDPVAVTPNIDRLASEGVLFTNAFASAPVCAPSRAAIITGMYQNAIGAQHMRTGFGRLPEYPGPYETVPPHYVKAFPEYLRAAGYFTSNAAKTDYQFGNPFTVWDDIGQNAHWRNRPDPEQPFFSVFNIEVTHEGQLFSQAARSRPLMTDPASVEVPPYYPDTPEVRRELAILYDNIALMDRRVGEILVQLEEDGLADNTIVFFWSDHGDGLPRAKRSPYDAGHRIALIVRFPESLAPAVAAGSVNDELVSAIDFAPTVLSLAGVPVPSHMHGRVFIGPHEQPEPRYLFFARDRMDFEYDMIRSVRDRDFLYIRNYHPELPYVGFIPYRNQGAIIQELFRLHAEGRLTGSQAIWMADRRPPEELYDRRADPHQIRNLAGDPAYREKLEEMRAALDGWLASIDDYGFMSEAEMVERMWPGGVQPQTAAPFVFIRGSSNQSPQRDSVLTLSGPAEVELFVPTQGASIGYTFDEGPDARWLLYSGPFEVDAPVTIRAKAIRYGYRESEETRVRIIPAGAAAE